MRMPVANIGRVLGRIREIEALVYPQQTVPDEEQKERFTKVMEEALDDPYEPVVKDKTEEIVDDGGIRTKSAPPKQEKNIQLPSGVDARLAMWEDDIQELASKYEVDPDLVRAVMRCESGGNPYAVSSAGAIGLMQLMPATARGLGVDPNDPRRNLEGGIKYLAQLADKYDGDYTKTLAAYNAGSGRVDSYGGIPPFPETQRYVKNVLALYRKYSRGD